MYKANTFVILHNTVFESICDSMLPPRLALIRSLHIHYSFRELSSIAVNCQGERDHFPPPHDDWTFAQLIRSICQRLPQLERLSVFLQGPLITFQSFGYVINRLREARRELKSLMFMAVRLPQPTADSVSARRRIQSLGINESLKRVQDSFHLIQPPLAQGMSEYDMADMDTGPSVGWKVGSLYTCIDKQSRSIESRNYAVLLVGAEEGEGARFEVQPLIVK
jgi:hypothetical protein